MTAAIGEIRILALGSLAVKNTHEAIVNNAPKDQDQPPQEAPRGARLGKLLAGAAFLGLAVSFYVFFRDSLTLENFAAQEESLRQLEQTSPFLLYAGAFLIYVGVTGLSIPGAALLSLVFAWFFGFERSLVLISFASTTGATLAFLMSRFVLRDFVQSRFGERLAAFNRELENEGAFYLFTLRLIPAVPFFVINAVMGLTKLKTRTFWWVSQLGMLPGTIAYTWAGASVPDLATLQEKGASSIISWQVFVAFAILGVLPLLLKKILHWASKPSRPSYADKSDESPETPSD